MWGNHWHKPLRPSAANNVSHIVPRRCPCASLLGPVGCCCKPDASNWPDLICTATCHVLVYHVACLGGLSKNSSKSCNRCCGVLAKRAGGRFWHQLLFRICCPSMYVHPDHISSINILAWRRHLTQTRAFLYKHFLGKYMNFGCIHGVCFSSQK